ncbi:uncharacterized protein Z520_03210 [Fonsecaea multimorphosa CBS 102226]|uniref:Transcription factor domain-containing protein n=1 Tax=Fonsecaea multimorphosa CBS 102226 TaxID=1442371 RepID=A0A0D2IU61_9EURO|nr:uncharacterized protein Z520_03210 [Fonsecaea multimorphosa CBS 102226]KIY00547.1 hypothetical protein Z520_03210 [Fonsecaea multimorphosa CBS 102226]
MQRVRQEELAQGKKRSTGRHRSNDGSKQKPRSESAHSEPSLSNESVENNASSPIIVAGSDTFRPTSSPLPSPRLSITPAAQAFDPFDTLPTNNLPHHTSESLLQYCFDVMLPLTFCVETKQTHDKLARQQMVMNSKMSNPATFLGFMATTAAHRAVFYGRHEDLAPSDANHDDLILDPDYIRVKNEAMVAVRRTFDQRADVDYQMLEACFGLIATATVVGNFAEARIHLKILERITSQLNLSEETMMWLPLSNVKVSVGLLVRPVLPLLFTREPLPAEVLSRAGQHLPSHMTRLGQDFMELERMSQPLKLLLTTFGDICRLCEMHNAPPRSPSPAENLSLRKKATELEFDLLAYPYEMDIFRRNSNTNEPEIPALEGVIRLAGLGMLSIAPHTILASTGLGRALTHHQKAAFEKWLLQEKGSGNGNAQETKAVCWALFVFVQNALKQPEQRFFTDSLALVAREAGLGLVTWEEVEQVIFGLLYIPWLQSSIWKGIWADVCKVRSASTHPLQHDIQ